MSKFENKVFNKIKNINPTTDNKRISLLNSGFKFKASNFLHYIGIAGELGIPITVNTIDGDWYVYVPTEDDAILLKLGA